VIYVVEVGETCLAFKAGSEAEAARIASSQWFARALDRFCVKRSGSRGINANPRAATAEEFVAFHNMSTEFADAAVEFLVARVG
jgi:hypothetical protein